MVKDQHPHAVKEATASVLPVWLEAFKVLLNVDPHQDVTYSNNWDGLAVRIQIFKVPSKLLNDTAVNVIPLLDGRHSTRSTLLSPVP